MEEDDDDDDDDDDDFNSNMAAFLNCVLNWYFSQRGSK